MTEIASIAGIIGALAFFLLFGLLFGRQKANLVGKLLLGCCLISGLWLTSIGIYYTGINSGSIISSRVLFNLEILRNASWFAFSSAILLGIETGNFRRQVFILSLFAAVVCVAALIVVNTHSASIATLVELNLAKFGYVLFLSMAIFGLLFVEQIYRNTHPDARWGIKHICIALFALFVYDTYLYAEGLLFAAVSDEIWAARGFINALVVPIIALSAKRNTDWNINVFVSRKIVFYSATVIGVGIYLLIVALAGYYLKSYGGTWGGALRIALLFGALVFLVTVVVSSQTRSRLRLFLAKHFYENKYEYGEVWLQLTDELSSYNGNAVALYESTVKAVTGILDSTGGMIWYRDRNNNFVLGGEWVLSGERPDSISADDPFIKKLEADQQTIDLHNVAATYHSGSDLTPKFILDMPRAWLVLPIMHAEVLVAFVIIAESRTNDSINWEDRDLLRTVSRQVGSYIALINTTDALTELKQFEAFNQLSAFLVHDLKNVVAQLSLVVRNSEKYKDNPEFIADSFTTIGDAVNKMNRMLSSLKHGHLAGRLTTELPLSSVVESAVARCSGGSPKPVLDDRSDGAIVKGNEDSLIAVLEHLVQNAQDATEISGEITVRVISRGNNAVIEISDTGSGMDAEFINNRLFKPFDTTKGKAGMGIGAYESRELIIEMGGRLTVESQIGVGSTFSILLPRIGTSQTSNQAKAITVEI